MRTLASQLIAALHYCHSAVGDKPAILHRDLKPENVLFSAAATPRLADFGLGQMLSRTRRTADSLVGTPGYIAPEVRKGLRYDHKADMYSLGCLLYDVCTLSTPRAADLCDTPSRVANDSLAKYSPDVQHLIVGLLEDQVRCHVTTLRQRLTSFVASYRLLAISAAIC